MFGDIRALVRDNLPLRRESGGAACESGRRTKKLSGFDVFPARDRFRDRPALRGFIANPAAQAAGQVRERRVAMGGY
ncbi:hypothetical protein [Lysobacter sp. Root690]|uniref:hypothetical protein n=1 Tax=Lysobacter sp. Root690 TaxID=1736588 RepID=UPI0012FC20E6|nr:hypothetical protein [Lysobacter sp. Root690]